MPCLRRICESTLTTTASIITEAHPNLRPSALELMPSSSSATTAEDALLRAKPVDWSSYGPTTHLNMYQAINSAMDIALASNPKVLLFGEDVG